MQLKLNSQANSYYKLFNFLQETYVKFAEFNNFFKEKDLALKSNQEYLELLAKEKDKLENRIRELKKTF